MDTSSFVNAAYNRGVVGIITVIYSMAARKVFKLKPADLGKLHVDVEDSLKLTATVGSALIYLLTNFFILNLLTKSNSDLVANYRMV